MQQPLVSVVIPTHNRLKFLKEAIASIKAQTLSDWELLIVDDASQDGTWEWLTELKDPQVRAFRQNENSLRARACNRVLTEAVGEFIMFLDDDDRLRPDALAKLVKPLSGDPKVVGAVGARWKFKQGAYAVRIEHPLIPFKRALWPELLAGWSAVPSQSLYRTATVREVGGWRPDFNPADDRDLWLRVARLGPVMLIPSIVVEYRAHDGQWRPKNIVELREKLFQEFIDRLPPEEQQRGKRIRESAHWSQKAEDDYRQGNYRTALTCYLKACKAAPEIAVSPLTGPPLARGIAKSLLRPLLRK